MKKILIRYKVKPEKVAENQQLIENVFEELLTKNPDGLRYVSFKMADGVSFVHIASVDTPDGSNPINAIDAFKIFQSGIRERCDEPPVATEMTEIGAFGM